MKNSITFSAIPSFAGYRLVACDSSSPEIIFESATPKLPGDLRAVPGSASQGRYTLRYHLSTGRKTAFITTAGASGHLPFGQQPYFRGVYYFSQSQKDNSSYKYAFNIRSSFTYDLNSCFNQRYQVAQQLS